MVGLLVLGCVAARRGHPFVGLALCAVAAQIKIPAILGDVYIGWWWSTSVPNWRARVERLLAAGAVSAGWIVAIAAAARLGWHWLKGLSNPGVVVSWLDPSTAVGLLLGTHRRRSRLHGSQRGLHLRLPSGGSLRSPPSSRVALLLRSNRRGPFFALGWSLLAVALLGPDIWPWYETWGIVILAVAAGAMDTSNPARVVGRSVLHRLPDRSVAPTLLVCSSRSSVGRLCSAQRSSTRRCASCRLDAGTPPDSTNCIGPPGRSRDDPGGSCGCRSDGSAASQFGNRPRRRGLPQRRSRVRCSPGPTGVHA